VAVESKAKTQVKEEGRVSFYNNQPLVEEGIVLKKKMKYQMTRMGKVRK
jgi:hypothetical protein